MENKKKDIEEQLALLESKLSVNDTPTSAALPSLETN